MSAICKPETRNARWCGSQAESEGLRPGVLVAGGRFSSSYPQVERSQPPPHFCSIQDFGGLEDANSHWGGPSASLSPLIPLQIPSGVTLTYPEWCLPGYLGSPWPSCVDKRRWPSWHLSQLTSGHGYIFIFFKIFFLKFISESKREKEASIMREYHWSPASCMPLNTDQACNQIICPNLESKGDLLGHGSVLNPWPTPEPDWAYSLTVVYTYCLQFLTYNLFFSQLRFFPLLFLWL